ncbi:glycosyltransferase family 4 protein [Candidatus Wolfebacteria bacterium]|nr:glycosyltransferase family 4 protein [Candidatus Wolfebacteria bacterium]
MEKIKLAIITSHVIQYQTPLFKKLAKHQEIDLSVYFCWKFGSEKTYDFQFGKIIEWDIPLLAGYKYKFLKNFSLNPSSDFWGQINFGIIIELIKNRPDAVLVYGWNSFVNWLVFITAFLSGSSVLLHGENPLNQELLKSKWKLAIKKIIFGKLLFPRVNAFLYIGEENKKFYQYYGVPEEKLFFTPYAVDNTRFINEAKNLKSHPPHPPTGGGGSNLKNSIGIDSNSIVILFVGKLIEKKRSMDLLKAYHKCITHNSKFIIHLLFVGDGALRSELEKYIKENNLKNIHFAGFKNQTELPQYYAMADIFVLPSGEGETWGLVVNEAMCFGLPVIVSDVVGCGKDLVKNEENGYIFPLGNIQKLSEYLTDLIKNSKKRESFGKKSFEIIQNYSHEKDIEGILKILKLLKQ